MNPDRQWLIAHGWETTLDYVESFISTNLEVVFLVDWDATAIRHFGPVTTQIRFSSPDTPEGAWSQVRHEAELMHRDASIIRHPATRPEEAS